MFDKLKQVRTDAGVSCETMAGVLGLKTRGGYYKKETGNVPFTLEEARLIAQYFGKAIEDIFFDGEVS